MTALFDSTILIAHLRGDERATLLLLEHVATGAFASVISRTEIEGGMRSPERSRVARLFEGIVLLPITDSIARRAGTELRRFRRPHSSIDLADHLIAATALEHGLQLHTLNIKHFPMIENLRLPW